MITQFIAYCQHSDYLFKEAYRERNDPALKETFLFVNLPGTLDKYLDAPGSPRKNKKVRSPCPNMDPIYSQIHQLDYLSNNERHIHQLTHVQEVSESVQCENPNFNSNHIIHYLVNKKDNNVAECVICGEPHKFEDCITL